MHIETKLTTVDERHTIEVDSDFSCNSVGTSFNGLVAIGSQAGLYISSRSMVSSDIVSNFTAP